MKMNKLLALIISLCLTMTSVAFMETADDPEIIEIEEAIVAEEIEPTVAEVDEIELGELSLDEEELTDTVDETPLLNEDIASAILAPSMAINKAASGIAVDETNFPDPVFRAYVSENFDTDHNGYLSDTEIALIRTVSVPDRGIASLDGIEYFTDMETLICWGNKLTELSVGSNPNLRYLNCIGNSISSLDFTNNPTLVNYIKREGVIRDGNTTRFVPIDKIEETDPYLAFDSSVVVKANDAVICSLYEPLTRTTDPITIGVKEKVYCLTTKPDTPYWLRQKAGGYVLLADTSNKKVAKTNSSGYVIGVKTGKAKITITTPAAVILTYTVNVKKAPSKVILSSTAMTLGVGEELPLTVTLPKGTASFNMTWTSSNPDVADFDDYGMIHGRKKGTATITVKAFNKKKATCKVTVLPIIESVSLPVSTLTLGVKQTYTLKPTLTPKASGSQLYTFSSSNKKVVSVTAAGKLTAKKKGTAKITVTTWNGLTASCNVSVVKVPKLTIKPTKLSLKTNDMMQLTHSFPESLPEGSITWRSSSPKIAYVNSYGLVFGVDVGTAIITAKAYNGQTAKCKVTVSMGTEPPTVDEDSDPDSIRYVQQMLCALGYLPKSNINGVYDAETRTAVKNFQIWVNQTMGENTLPVTGTADPKTLNALEYAYDHMTD